MQFNILIYFPLPVLYYTYSFFWLLQLILYLQNILCVLHTYDHLLHGYLQSLDIQCSLASFSPIPTINRRELRSLFTQQGRNLFTAVPACMVGYSYLEIKRAFTWLQIPLLSRWAREKKQERNSLWSSVSNMAPLSCKKTHKLSSFYR